VGRLLAQSPQDYVNRIYDIPHDVNFARVSATTSAPSTPRIETLNLRVAPLPASDHVDVACSGITSGGQLVLVNTLGQTVLTKSIAPSDGVQGTTLDVRSLPAGTYSVQVRTGRGVVASTPIVIVR
jgi:hypothetical protein